MPLYFDENPILALAAGSALNKVNTQINKTIQNHDKYKYSNAGVNMAKIQAQKTQSDNEYKIQKANIDAQKMAMKTQERIAKQQAKNGQQIQNFQSPLSQTQIAAEAFDFYRDCFLEGYYDALNDIEIEDVFKNFEDEYGKDNTTELTTFKDMKQRDGFVSSVKPEIPNTLKIHHRLNNDGLNGRPFKHNNLDYIK